jgi:hypothetical protein
MVAAPWTLLAAIEHFKVRLVYWQGETGHGYHHF